MIKAYTFRCSVCGKPKIDEAGYDPAPLEDGGFCCEECFWEKVFPARIEKAAGVPELG